MYASVAAWFVERLLGAELVVVGPGGAKLVLGVTASSTLSVLLRDTPRVGMVAATLQFAKRGGNNIEERELEEKTVAAIVGQLALAAAKRGMSPAATSKPILSEDQLKVDLTPMETLRFATEYAAHASGVKQMVVKCINQRVAAVVTVPGGTLWIDLASDATTTTSTASVRPTRTVYSKGTTVDYRSYKWRGSTGYIETVQTCKAVLTEICRIVR